MENKDQTHSTKNIKRVESMILLAIFLIMAYLLDNYFFTLPVIVSVLKGVALISVLVMAESIVLAAGGIDLSIASIGLLSSSIMFFFVENELTGVLPAIIISLISGGFIGLINGLFVSKLRIHSVIVTMSTALFARGVSGAISNNIVIFNSRLEFAFLKSVYFQIIPKSLIIALGVMVCCYLIFRFTIVGRQIFAVGGSEESARLSGLKVDRIKILTYTGAGFIASIGGLLVMADTLMAARFFSASADIEVILAAIIGGVSLFSRANIFFRACVGAAIIAALNRIIYGLFVFDYMRAIIIGGIALVVIALKKSMFKRKKSE